MIRFKHLCEYIALCSTSTNTDIESLYTDLINSYNLKDYRDNAISEELYRKSKILYGRIEKCHSNVIMTNELVKAKALRLNCIINEKLGPEQIIFYSEMYKCIFRQELKAGEISWGDIIDITDIKCEDEEIYSKCYNILEDGLSNNLMVDNGELIYISEDYCNTVDKDKALLCYIAVHPRNTTEKKRNRHNKQDVRNHSCKLS